MAPRWSCQLSAGGANAHREVVTKLWYIVPVPVKYFSRRSLLFCFFARFACSGRANVCAASRIETKSFVNICCVLYSAVIHKTHSPRTILKRCCLCIVVSRYCHVYNGRACQCLRYNAAWCQEFCQYFLCILFMRCRGNIFATLHCLNAVSHILSSSSCQWDKHICNAALCKCVFECICRLKCGCQLNRATTATF